MPRKPTHPLALKKGHKANFETLKNACLAQDLALLSCLDAKTHAPVAVVCAVNRVDGEFEFVPIARLFDGNPYDELIPPGSPACTT